MEIELTKENYDGEVIKSNMPVLVDILGFLVRTLQNGCAYNLTNCRGIQR